MSKVVFSSSRCVRCNLCSRACPRGIIGRQAGSLLPFIAPADHDQCIECGHCEAICPTDAVVLTGAHLESSAFPVAADLSSEQVAGYFQARRSIRLYKPEPIGQDRLEQLFDIVRYAPTALNRQPLGWIVINGPEKVRAVARTVIDWTRAMLEKKHPMALQFHFDLMLQAWDNGGDPICRKASCLVVAHGLKEDRMAGTDATIALAHLELAAPAFKLGACWAGYVGIAASMSPEVRAALGVSENQACLGVMMLGHPAVDYRRPPKRKPATLTFR
jgi:nitroreductase/NAD-dependent dihydropyrimidine dehydrogenase PreA subunit